MIRPLPPVLGAIAAALLVSAANATPVGFEALSTNVSSRASCNFGAATFDDRSSCAVVSPASESSAHAETVVDGGHAYDGFAGFFDSGFFMTVRAVADAQNTAPSRDGSATATITATVALHTDGPVRQGYADFYLLGGPFGCAWPDCSASVSVGSQTYTDLGGYRARPDLYSVPITLGTNTIIVLRAFAQDQGSGADLVSASVAGIDVSFREEASRVVRMSSAALTASETPEPASLAMLLLGVFFLIAASRRATSR